MSKKYTYKGSRDNKVHSTSQLLSLKYVPLLEKQ